MSAGRRSGLRPGGREPGRRPGHAPGPGRLNQAGVAAALQRAVGNNATGAMLARRPAKATATTATFRVMIVDDGNTGLSQKTRDVAIGHVRDELAKVTAGSSNDLVKAGFDVQYRKTAPERGKDFGAKDLDVTTFLVFLMRRKDAKQAVDISYRYLRLDERDREQYLANATADLGREGGHNLQTYKPRPGHPSESVSFVGVDEPARMEQAQSFGPDSAGRLMAEVILHELGHAMGHVHYEDDEHSIAHDKSGIMAPSMPIGSAGPYAPAGFSRKSIEVIRKRLEALAERIAARTKTP
jgi:hypothetical protein